MVSECGDLLMNDKLMGMDGCFMGSWEGEGTSRIRRRKASNKELLFVAF